MRRSPRRGAAGRATARRPSGARSGAERFGDRLTALLTDPAPLGALDHPHLAAGRGDARRLPRAHARATARRSSAPISSGSRGTARARDLPRPRRHRDAHARRLRARARHARRVALDRPRATLSLDQRDLGLARGRGRRVPGTSRLAGAPASRTTIIITGTATTHDHHHHDHHDHWARHDHGHRTCRRPATPITLRSLVALGVSGGLLPCPSALVVMLGADRARTRRLRPRC